MPEGVGYGPQNTASVGINLNIIGNYCYAYSGSLTLANTTTLTPLEFTTGSEIVESNLQISVDVDALSSAYLTFIAYINDQVVMYDVDRRDLNIPQNDFKFVIPPYSTFKVTVLGANDATAAVLLTGKIHK